MLASRACNTSSQLHPSRMPVAFAVPPPRAPLQVVRAGASARSAGRVPAARRACMQATTHELRNEVCCCNISTNSRPDLSSQSQPIDERSRASSHASSSGSSSPRRAFLLGASASIALAASSLPAEAVTFAPPGYRIQDDKLDGYRFFYPGEQGLMCRPWLCLLGSHVRRLSSIKIGSH